jgi:hypothetical protein
LAFKVDRLTTEGGAGAIVINAVPTKIAIITIVNNAFFIVVLLL